MSDITIYGSYYGLDILQSVFILSTMRLTLIIDINYKNLLNRMGKQSDHTSCGHNKKIFMLNVETFKKSCLKTGTKKQVN
jgi:hypothetical protein